MHMPWRAMDTVVVENEFGAVLKYPESFRVSLVQRPHDATCIHQVSDKNLSTPLHPQTEAPSLDGTPGTVRKRKRKRVRKTELNRGEALQMEYHSQIKEDVMRCYTSLVAAARKMEYFPVQDPGEKAACSGLDLQSLCDLDALVPVEYQQEPLWLERDSDHNVDVFGRMICNPADHSVTISAFERKLLIPSHSSFLLSDFSKMELLCVGKRYSLIVIDPPWENRSAIRGKKYRWLSSNQLLDLPLPHLANEGALVVVWVTNKRKLANFVKKVLFPSWQVACVGEWHWIKVTTHGDPVFDMDSTHKKPYETLILGRFHEKSLDSYAPHDETTSTHQSQTAVGFPFHAEVVETRQDGSSSGLDLDTPSAKRCCQDRSLERTCQTNYEMHKEHDCSKGGNGEVCEATSIPYHRVVVCIPSNIHSQKPYLGDILSKYLPKEKHCLELFARNLLPGWTSWGNEVLKFQEINQLHPQCQKNKLEASTTTIKSELKQN